MKKRALISVSDKNGVVDAAKRLAAMGYEIISTGGTQKCLEDAGLKTLNISDVTGFPECLDGRVKTLHPAVHAGLLAKRDNAEHMRRLKELKIQTIDVVIVNLYPFKQTVMSGKGFDEVVENIDIGGPTMLRSAAKNSGDVVVLTDPADYEKALSELEAYPLITLGAGTTSHAFYVSVFTAQGVAFQPAIEAATADQIIPMAEAGLGVGIVPEAFIRPSDNVRRIELQEPLPLRAVCIVKRKGQPLSVAARELERMLLAAGAQST